MSGFDEWKEQQETVQKAPAAGGILSPISPGFGMTGPRSTASFDSWRPAPGFNNNPTNSKYTRNPQPEPLPFINDVDMESNFYSPMQPVWPLGPIDASQAREWDYPTGYNLNFIQQRQIFMAQLRGMRASWGVLATIIETRKDQLIRVPWTVQQRNKPKIASKGVDEVKRFLRSPDGKLSYIQWTRKLLDDLLVLDAPTVYFDHDRAGRVRYVEVIDGACYCEDTEVLTKRGWIKFQDAYTDDEFATRNRMTSRFEWQKATYFHQQDWTGKPMIRFSSRTLDLLVTPTHRMLVQLKSSVANGSNTPECVIPANEITEESKWCIPATSIWEGEAIKDIVFAPTTANIRGNAEKKGKLPGTGRPGLAGSGVGIVKICETCGDNFIIHPYRAAKARFCSNRCRSAGLAKTVKMTGDQFCAFMGMWLSEGCTGDGDRIFVSQKNFSKGYEEFKNLIIEICGKEPYYNGSYWDIHSRALFVYLQQFGLATAKFIPEEIKNASVEQLKIFWHYFMLGDGTFSGGREKIATSSRMLADDLQEIAQKIGKSAGVYTKAYAVAMMGDREITPTSQGFTVNLRESEFVGIEKIEEEKFYAGNVYCVSVPNEFLYIRRNGRPVWCGNTIFPLIDDAGRRPDAPQPAFQQIIKGLPMRNFDETQLLYAPMHVRPDVPIFGYPGTEQILIEASEAIRKTFYQLSFWAEGTIPDLIVTVPDSWTPRQIAMFQAHTDALLSGNLTLKSKIRYLPGGMKPFDVKNANGESLWSQRDETLIRLACYAYSVSPTPFVKQTNRSVAQNAQQSSEEEGLYPLMSYWKDDIMDRVIERCGYDDIEFVFLPRPEPDAEKQAKIHQIYAKEGILKRNEIRAELGREAEPGGDELMIELGNIIVPLSSAAQGEAASANPQASVSSASGKSGDEARNSAPAGGQPLRGASVPNHKPSTPPTPTQKAATAGDVETAARDANGDVGANSHLQLSRGNYKMGHVWMHGLNISIENSRGSKRGKKNADGKKRWENVLPAHYGYIRGTLGADGDQIDVFIGECPESRTVWVIDQHKVGNKGKLKDFDEHKVMLGFDTFASALKIYLQANASNQGLARIAAVVELSITDFKSWLAEGKTHLPINESGFGTIVVDAKMLRKADTISTSSGLSSYSQLPAKRKRKKRRVTTRGPKWLQLNAEV